MRRAAASILLVLVPTSALAWGAQGHRVAATLASQRLAPAARERVESLLARDADGRSLSAVSMWADRVRYTEMPQTYNWHFVNIPLSRDRYDAERDCREIPGKGDCVIAAVQRLRQVLGEPRRSRSERAEALKLLVHLVADLHQPLHAAERSGDQGATEVEVVWLGQSRRPGRRGHRWTLHAVWDDGLIRESRRRTAPYVVQLNAWLATQDESAIRRGDAVEWALEAHAVAREEAYRDADGSGIPVRGARLGRSYYEARIAAVDRQLARAGVRLARVLNEALR